MIGILCLNKSGGGVVNQNQHQEKIVLEQQEKTDHQEKNTDHHQKHTENHTDQQEIACSSHNHKMSPFRKARSKRVKDIPNVSLSESEHRQKIKNNNPIQPCGVCSEWLRKIASVNPSFRIVTFTDSDWKSVKDARIFNQHVTPLKQKSKPKSRFLT